MDNQNAGTFSCNCQKCGRTLYEGEMLNIKGKYVCEPCADAFIFGGAGVKRKSVPSSFFHFLFSFHPGAGQMYLGLMKRGLCQMCLFYLSIYLTAVAMPEFFGLVIPIIYIYSFFDSLSLRRRMVAGEYVPDNMEEAVKFLNRNKGLVIIAAVIISIMCLFSGIFVNSDYGVKRFTEGGRVIVEHRADDGGVVQYEVIGSSESRSRGKMIGPFVLVCVGGLIMMKAAKRKKASKVSDTEIIEHEGKSGEFKNYR